MLCFSQDYRWKVWNNCALLGDLGLHSHIFLTFFVPRSSLQGFEARGTELRGRRDAMKQLSCECSLTTEVTLQDLNPSSPPTNRSCPPVSCIQDDGQHKDTIQSKRKKRDISQTCSHEQLGKEHIWALSRENVPWDLCCCHTKRRIGGQGPEGSS